MEPWPEDTSPRGYGGRGCHSPTVPVQSPGRTEGSRSRPLTASALAHVSLPMAKWLLVLTLVGWSTLLRAQGANSSSTAPWLAPRSLAVHRLAGHPPIIDGRIDDSVWAESDVATDFSTMQPNPGSLARLRTEVRVLYDDDAVYIAFRAFDPHPERLVAPYPRRDNEETSEWVFAEFDTRDDHRTAYSFGLNPRGVQADGTFTADTLYDHAWDGVWEGAARMDSVGWTAEFRIPFAQMALGAPVDGHLVWGASFYRQSVSGRETSDWSPRLPTYSGVVSHFNELIFDGKPKASRRIEVVPYAGLRETTAPLPTGDPFRVSGISRPTAGADVRAGLTPALTLTAAIHPDFGQVEADPSVLNLSAFETFFPEQRPFFVAGADAFSFDLSLPFTTRDNSFSLESPFYSRRIGRAPEGTLPAAPAFVDAPAFTDILGAAKVSGRTADGWSIGALSALTDREMAAYADSGGIHTAAVEPLTAFTVARVSRDFDHSESAVGAIATVVNRFGMDGGLGAQLVRDAYVVGADARHRFGAGNYEIRGFVAASEVIGSPASIRAVATGPGHYFQRPDAGYIRYDTSATELQGATAHIRLAQVGGNWRWNLTGHLITPGFDINDVGFQRNADWALITGQLLYLHTRPSPLFQDWWLGSDEFGVGWDTHGERRAAVLGLHGGFDLNNRWSVYATVHHELSALSLEALRGGPGLVVPPRTTWTLSGASDWQRRWQYFWTLSGYSESGSGSRDVTVAPALSAIVSNRLTLGTGPTLEWTRSGWQYVAGASAFGIMHYVLGAAREVSTSWTFRADYAFSAHLTLQVYAQPFIASAGYSRFQEVVAPRAATPANRLRPIVATFDSSTQRYEVDVDGNGTPDYSFANPAVNEKDFNATMVLRWEFRPGSAFFLVWTQQRNASASDGSYQLGRDLRRLFTEPATNVLLAKVSYWWGP